MNEPEVPWFGRLLYPTVFDPSRVQAPETVYHYTSQKGLFGILNSRTLWASDIRYLNDTSELRYGLDMLAEGLKDRASEVDVRLAETIAEVFDSIRVSKYAPHVVCFSAVRNDLSQWAEKFLGTLERPRQEHVKAPLHPLRAAS